MNLLLRLIIISSCICFNDRFDIKNIANFEMENTCTFKVEIVFSELTRLHTSNNYKCHIKIKVKLTLEQCFLTKSDRIFNIEVPILMTSVRSVIIGFKEMVFCSALSLNKEQHQNHYLDQISKRLNKIISFVPNQNYFPLVSPYFVAPSVLILEKNKYKDENFSWNVDMLFYAPRFKPDLFYDARQIPEVSVFGRKSFMPFLSPQIICSSVFIDQKINVEDEDKDIFDKLIIGTELVDILKLNGSKRVFGENLIFESSDEKID